MMFELFAAATFAWLEAYYALHSNLPVAQLKDGHTMVVSCIHADFISQSSVRKEESHPGSQRLPCVNQVQRWQCLWSSGLLQTQRVLVTTVELSGATYLPINGRQESCE